MAALPTGKLAVLLASLFLHSVTCLDLSLSSQPIFQEASEHTLLPGVVEAQPRFFVPPDDPGRAPDGAPPDWPLKYDLFKEREVAADLIAWLQANGVDSIGVPTSPLAIEIDYNTTLRASGRSRGNFRIVAGRNISEGEVVAKLPLGLGIYDAFATPAVGPTPLPKDALEYCLIASWILAERAKGEASPWHAYLRSLPHFIPSPFFFADDIIQQTQYPRFITEREELMTSLHVQFKMLAEAKALGSTNFTDFLWAVMVASSRSIGVPANTRLPKPGALGLGAASSSSGATAQGGATETAGAGGSKSQVVSALSWEDEFLLGEDEIEELKEVSMKKPGGKDRSTDGRDDAPRSKALLVPLLDLFDWDDDDNETHSVTLQIEEHHLLVQASRDVVVGQPLLLKLPESQNEEHLFVRGFLPRVNHHDGALLFSNRNESLWFFAKRFFVGKVNDNVQYTMDDTFDIAEEFLSLTVKRKVRYRDIVNAHPEYRVTWDRFAPSFAWWGAVVDPHVLAALAAGHSVMLNNKTPNYWDVVAAALSYAWKMANDISCDSLAAVLPDKDSDSFPVAGTCLRARAEELLSSFNSTVTQDLGGIETLLLCRELAVFGRTSIGLDFGAPAEELLKRNCPDLLLHWLPEMDIVFRFRISKKAVLIQLIERMKKTCDMFE